MAPVIVLDVIQMSRRLDFVVLVNYSQDPSVVEWDVHFDLLSYPVELNLILAASTLWHMWGMSL